MHDALVRGEIHAQAGMGVHIQRAAVGQVQCAHALDVGGHLGVIQLAGRTHGGGQHRTQQRGGHGQGWAPHRRFALGQRHGFIQLLQLGQVGPQLFELGIGAGVGRHRLPLGKGLAVGAGRVAAVAGKPTGGLGIDGVALLDLQGVDVAQAVHSGCSMPGSG